MIWWKQLFLCFYQSGKALRRGSEVFWQKENIDIDLFLYNVLIYLKNTTHMDLPYKLALFPKDEYADKFGIQFWKSGRKVNEMLWRRTQLEKNKDESGWKSETDLRKKLVHGLDGYTMETHEKKNLLSLNLNSVYLYFHMSMPKAELSSYKDKLHESLKLWGWMNLVGSKDRVRWSLRLSIRENVEDTSFREPIPDGYESIEFSLISDGNTAHKLRENYPWIILKNWIREKNKPGNYIKTKSVDDIMKYFPAQVETGGGASIECWVPPLKRMHEVYSVLKHPEEVFIRNAEEDNLVTLLLQDPEGFYFQASEIQRKALEAKPSLFYDVLKRGHKKGLFVGPIITNNYDGLVNLKWLEDHFVRKFDPQHLVPEIEFHPEAKSLIVVWSHADRRMVQAAARAFGLKVIYVDPEGYHEGNIFSPYPLEWPQDWDIHLQWTAREFAEKILRAQV